MAFYMRSWFVYSIAFCLVFLMVVPHPGAAFSVVGSKIEMDISAGQTYDVPMAVVNGPSEPSVDIAIDVLGFGQTGGGTYSGLDPASDVSPYTARPFITVTAPTIHLNPGDRHGFNVTIRVPAGAGSGGRYAQILIHPLQATGGSGNVAIITQYMLSVKLTLQGTTLTHTGSITSIQAGEVMGDQGSMIPTIQTTLKNTGNHHYTGAFVNVTITDSSGKVVTTPFTKPFLLALIPGNEMILTTPIATAIAPGTYTVKSEAKLADGTLLDSKTVSIPIGVTATAATGGGQPPASLTAAPGGATPAPGGAAGTHKLWILPIYTPGPDALVTVGVVSAAMLIWSMKRRR